MNETGQKEWSFSLGNIPLKSTGTEPAFVSKDLISILNASKEAAQVKLIIYFNDQEEVGEYEIEVEAERVRKVRINDLIDPHAIPLGVAYGVYLKSNVPVVVQFTRHSTAQDQLALMGATAYGESPDDSDNLDKKS